MVDRKISGILLIGGLFCLISLAMSIYSISTTNWSTIGPYNIGLFQTCAYSRCIRNQYRNINYELASPPIFANQLYNAAPLAIVGAVLQLIVCILCFLTAFIYLPPNPSITCYICPFLIFIAFIFQLSTIAQASYGIYLNGSSSIVFETALVLEVVVIIFALLAADRVNQINNIP